jgi:hypothetical protein
MLTKNIVHNYFYPYPYSKIFSYYLYRPTSIIRFPTCVELEEFSDPNTTYTYPNVFGRPVETSVLDPDL